MPKDVCGSKIAWRKNLLHDGEIARNGMHR